MSLGTVRGKQRIFGKDIQENSQRAGSTKKVYLYTQVTRE